MKVKNKNKKIPLKSVLYVGHSLNVLFEESAEKEKSICKAHLLIHLLVLPLEDMQVQRGECCYPRLLHGFVARGHRQYPLPNPFLPGGSEASPWGWKEACVWHALFGSPKAITVYSGLPGRYRQEPPAEAGSGGALVVGVPPLPPPPSSHVFVSQVLPGAILFLTLLLPFQDPFLHPTANTLGIQPCEPQQEIPLQIPK